MPSSNPLQPVISAWIGAIRRAIEFKRKNFQDDADEAMKFYNGPYDFIYKSPKQGGPAGFASSDMDQGLSFKMTHNRVAEMVQLYVPTMYHNNPVRQARPRSTTEIDPLVLGDPNDPRVQMVYQQLTMQKEVNTAKDKQLADLMERVLNYTPKEFDLRGESRFVIEEALIKGMSFWWPALTRRPGGQYTFVGSFYENVNNITFDPDMRSMTAAKWMCRKVVKPYWEFEKLYGLKKGSLRQYTSLESLGQQGAQEADPHNEFSRRQGHTQDLMVVWEVYSKMGAGNRLLGYGSVQDYMNAISPELESLGDYVFLAISEKIPFPLNLPDEILASGNPQDIFTRAQWPAPLWADGAWPCIPLYFHTVPGQLYPVSHVKFGIGELCFLNWAYSFLANKVRTTGKDYMAVEKSANAEIKNIAQNGFDFEMIELDSHHSDLGKVIQFMQHPGINAGLLQVTSMMSEAFDKRMGLMDPMYGQPSTEPRSATSSQYQQMSVRIRPDDMAATVDAQLAKVARTEAILTRLYVKAGDVQPLLGDYGAQLWQAIVETTDVSKIMYEMEYTIEEGSARKRWTDETNMSAAMNNLGPVLIQLGQAQGNNFEMLYQLLRDWAKANGLEADKYIPSQQVQQGPSPEEQQMQQQQQQAQAEQQMKEKQLQLDQMRKEETHQQDIRHDQEKHSTQMALMEDTAKHKTRIAVKGNGKK